jgi:hypothetical protein
MVATPALSAPGKAVAGQHVKLTGAGFRAGSKVKIVFDTPKHVTVGSARARPDGTFKASIEVPRRAGAGTDHLQVVGTGQQGQPMSLAAPVIVVSEHTAIATATPGASLAGPVLLTIAVLLPLTTWLALEMMGWRGRRYHKRGVRS